MFVDQYQHQGCQWYGHHCFCHLAQFLQMRAPLRRLRVQSGSWQPDRWKSSEPRCSESGPVFFLICEHQTLCCFVLRPWIARCITSVLCLLKSSVSSLAQSMVVIWISTVSDSLAEITWSNWSALVGSSSWLGTTGCCWWFQLSTQSMCSLPAWKSSPGPQLPWTCRLSGLLLRLRGRGCLSTIFSSLYPSLSFPCKRRCLWGRDKSEDLAGER